VVLSTNLPFGWVGAASGITIDTYTGTNNATTFISTTNQVPGVGPGGLIPISLYGFNINIGGKNAIFPQQ
jgi:hypothetical protein